MLVDNAAELCLVISFPAHRMGLPLSGGLFPHQLVRFFPPLDGQVSLPSGWVGARWSYGYNLT